MSITQLPSNPVATYIQGSPSAKKLAVVLPGKLDTKDYPHMRSHVDFLAEKGYLALSFDPPGTWESPGDIGLYTMTNYLAAINELIAYFGNKPTFVIGHSRGGSMAMLAGVENPHITSFAAIMSYYSFDPKVHGDFPDTTWKKRGYKTSRRDIPFTEPTVYREFNLPYSFLEDEVHYDVTAVLAKCKKPKLFILGKRDVLVPPSIVREGFDLSAEPKQLIEIDCAHDYRKHPDKIKEVEKIIEKFINTYPTE